MSNDVQVVLRVPADLVERVDALVERVADDPELSTFGRVSRSAVLRLALLRGMAVLEQQYGAHGRRRR